MQDAGVLFQLAAQLVAEYRIGAGCAIKTQAVDIELIDIVYMVAE